VRFDSFTASGKKKKMNKNPSRCPWPSNNELMIKYHDNEWGRPVYDDQKLFEYMVLDAFQAGLSWQTIINKRENFRKAFDNFDPVIISKYNEKKIQSLMKDAGIIRNQLKIRGTVKNAKAYLETQKEFGSFAKYIWSFVNFSPVDNKPSDLKKIRTSSRESDTMSKDLKKRGFTFVGSTICYAFMQAAGLVNDHLLYCKHRNGKPIGKKIK
jgi:DNA-3-methyladenine glycosylase I